MTEISMKEMAGYLRMHVNSFRRQYNAAPFWNKSLVVKGTTSKSNRYVFNKEEVLEYIEKTFN